MSAVERWLPIAGYEGSYEVSDLGRVRSLDRIDSGGHARIGKVLSPCAERDQHLSVTLCTGGSRRNFQVHHLVLVTFVGPCPPGMEGCHWNDIPDDNRLANLRWDTRRANALDSIRNGNHAQGMKTHCPQGHPYSGSNLRVYKGTRHCIECQEIRNRSRSQKREVA